jgi:hypothetical protein
MKAFLRKTFGPMIQHRLEKVGCLRRVAVRCVLA